MATDVINSSRVYSMVNPLENPSTDVPYECPPPTTTIQLIARRHIEAAFGCITGPSLPTGCLYTDIGNSLCEITLVVARLAEELVMGDHIKAYTRQMIHQENRDTDFSNLSNFDDAERKHRHLKSMLEKLKGLSADVRDEWSHAPTSRNSMQNFPERVTDVPQRLSPMSSVDDEILPPVQQSGFQTEAALNIARPNSFQYPENAVIGPQHSIIPTAADYVTDHHPATTPATRSPLVNMTSLQMRGKGTYTCPQGFHCKKGGVVNGRLVVFERNCVFRAHLHKHDKPYRCQLSGCQNRNGFARIDQLRRHQEVVKHEAG